MNHDVVGRWQETFNDAVNLFQRGDLAGAETACQHLLQQEPDNEISLYLLAQVLHGRGRPEEAAACLRRLVAINPAQSRYHNDLGVMLAAKGKWPEAEACYRLAVAVDAGNADAVFNHALALLRLKRIDEARSALGRLPVALADLPDVCALRGELARAAGDAELAVREFRKAISLGLSTADVHVNLGLALEDLSREEDAFDELCRAERIDPDDAMACFHLGNSHRARGDIETATRYYRKAIALRPDLAEAHNNLGLLLQPSDEAAAAECFQRALDIAPNLDAAYTNLGSCRIKQGAMEAAVESFRKALELNPDSHEAWNNLGNVYLRLQRLGEAEHAYRQALRLQPEYREADLNLGILLLLRGDFQAGWPHYESRWAMPEISAKRPKFKQPEWLGEPLAGRTLLVYAEQGMGDNLQFARYLPLLRERHPQARILFWSVTPLFRLFANCAARWGVEILPPTVQLDTLSIDCHAALLSLPGRMGTTLESIPAQIPYIVPDRELVERWAARLGKLPGKKVGIVWASGETYVYHRFRTMRLTQLAPLFDIAGVSWVSLQKGRAEAEIAEAGWQARIVDPMGDVEDFADTAALIANLDLVVSVDTSVPHLAGAMGVPVWLLDRFDTDWRWLLDRSDSPWYPAMRIFRQSSFGQWSPVVAAAAEALRAWCDGTAPAAERPAVAALPDVVEAGRKLKLNLGCGNRKEAGFVNVDCVAACAPDLVVNLEQTPWPWGDDSVNEVKLTHVLEHLGQSPDAFLAIVRELWRVCSDGARIDIAVPHPRSDFFIGDPTHVRPITGGMLNLFNRRLNREWAAVGAANTPLGDILGVDFEVESVVHDLMPRWREALNSGRMSETEVMQAIDDFNNVVEQTRIVWRVHKRRY
ncbi:MAG: tetratricopeptide repeat protein [Rhodocyclales bacterium]|nr:tetratricopeptide repeat protein [Rhodocyclales bacterium]